MKNNEFEEKSFEINGRTVEYRVKISEQIKQDLLNISEKDKEFIAYSLVDAEILLKQLDETKDLTNYSAIDLDDLINLWRYKRSSFKLVNEDEFVNAIGAAFGNCLNGTFHTVWSIIIDEYGTDFACISEEPKFQTFPFSSVWKAVEEGKEGSLQAIIDLVEKHLKDGDFL